MSVAIRSHPRRERVAAGAGSPVYVGLLTLILGLAMENHVIAVTAGALDTTRISTDLETALLLGLFCGFSEQTLPANVAQRVGDFVGRFSPSGGGSR